MTIGIIAAMDLELHELTAAMADTDTETVSGNEVVRGTVEGSVVTVFAPDDMTRGRLDNDRATNALRDSGASLTGGPVTVRLVVGEPPKSSPEDLRRNLIQFGSQFDAITTK